MISSSYPFPPIASKPIFTLFLYYPFGCRENYWEGGRENFDALNSGLSSLNDPSSPPILLASITTCVPTFPLNPIDPILILV